MSISEVIESSHAENRIADTIGPPNAVKDMTNSLFQTDERSRSKIESMRFDGDGIRDCFLLCTSRLTIKYKELIIGVTLVFFS